MTKHYRIICLGEIIAPDASKAIQAFSKLVAEKTQQSFKEVVGKIVEVLHANLDKIEEFKLGRNEEDFTKDMLHEIKKATGATLTVQEFDDAWNAMNPAVDTFKDTLIRALLYNNMQDRQVIFISSTNPKDMRHFAQELSRENPSGMTCCFENDKLTYIANIPVLTSYAEQKTKPQLLASVAKLISDKSYTPNLFARDKQKVEENDIKYIRSRRLPQDPKMQQQEIAINTAIDTVAKQYNIEPFIWETTSENLGECLRRSEMNVALEHIAKPA